LNESASIARFQREAQAVARLEHPGIASVYYIGQDGKISFLAMQYIEGSSLRAVLGRLESPEGPVEEGESALRAVEVIEPESPVLRFDEPTATYLPAPGAGAGPSGSPTAEAEAEAIRIRSRVAASTGYIRRCCEVAREAAQALAHAHERGVIHRDIKPENILIDGRGRAYLIDFGLARFFEDVTLTSTGSLLGTPMYMSPEQAQGLPVDARSDVWSLASVLYEALAGRTAYDARDTYEQMIVQIVTQRPRRLAEVAPHVPEAIARVVESTLVHDVDARCPDASTFAKKLAEAARIPNAQPSGSDPTVLAASPPSSARGSGVATGASPPTGTGVVVGARTQRDAGIPRKRSPLILVGAGTAMLLVALGIAAVATREPAGKTSPGGLVAPPASEPRVSEPPPVVATTTALPATSLSPLTTDVPASIDAGVAVAPRPPATSRAATRPTANAAQPPTPPKPASTQYGAAGVSTAY
jgi:serine/threonine protein kinase